MKNQILFIILCLGSCILPLDSFSQITRGVQPNEIYMSNDWYFDGSTMHRAVFRSIDNGEHVSIQYTSTNPPMGGDMMIGKLVGDATLGTIYSYIENELWRSMDFGESWDFIENYYSSGFYTSGGIEGEIYKNGTDVAGTLFFSNNFFKFSENNIEWYSSLSY